MSNNQQQVGISIGLGVSGGSEIQSATEQIQELNKNISKTGKSDIAKPVKTLKQELKEAVNEASRLAAQGQQNTQAYVNAARRVTELRNGIDEMNNSLKAFDPDNKFRVASNAATAAARAVQGYSGALAFVGVEGEDAAQALLKLQGITAFADGLDGLLDLQDSFFDLLRMLGLNLTATNVSTAANVENAASATAQGIAQTELTTATVAQTVVQEAQTVAVEGTTLASKALKVALVSIGIGAAIALVSYLVANWDSLKTTITSLFPAMEKSGEMFNKVKNIAIGAGNAIINFLIKPYTGLYKLLTGDFKGAMNDFQKALNITGNFKAGQLIGEVSDAKAKNKEILANEIKTQESKIKILKASGKDTTALERDTLNKKLALNKEDKTKYKELLEEKALFEASTAKKIADEADKKRKEKQAKDKAASDKYKADLRNDLDSIIKNNEDALKIIANATATERDSALADLDAKYKKELELLEKRKKDLKDYNLQFANLTNARKVEESGINKKFDDDINNYLRSVQGDTVSSYQKTIDEINKVINEKLKNATPEQAAALNLSRSEQVTKITNLKTLGDNSQLANTDLTKSENNNRPSDSDTPEQAAAKVANVNAAKLNAENAAFELKKAQLVGQNQQLAQLAAEHEANITSINDAETKSRIELGKAEKEAKLANLDAVSTGLNSVSGLVNENSIANKAFGVSSAVIDTYVGANKAFAQGGFLGFASAAAVITAGLANVKKIMSVKIPNSSNSGTTGRGFTAPQINSTVLGAANNGTNEIVKAVNTDKKQVVEAIITTKSFKQYEAKQEVIKNQSSY